MGDFEDILEQMREGSIDGEEAAEKLERFSATSLRKKAGERDEFEKRALAAEEKVAKLEGAPARREALEKYGIDFDALRPAEKRLLEQFEGDLTDEAIAELVEQNDLPVINSEGSDEGTETSDAEKIANTARRGGGGGGIPKVTPGDVAEWTAERWVKFAEANPDAAEALRRGEEVTGVTG